LFSFSFHFFVDFTLFLRAGASSAGIAAGVFLSVDFTLLTVGAAATGAGAAGAAGAAAAAAGAGAT
jgi:hypothetical protein